MRKRLAIVTTYWETQGSATQRSSLAHRTKDYVPVESNPQEGDRISDSNRHTPV
ncbi:hypothetical protein G9A89_016852 [Geosiphon pyriformis]|nr:hypothetical protein G9A89_016852 [Geosiphon pyriformis]